MTDWEESLEAGRRHVAKQICLLRAKKVAWQAYTDHRLLHNQDNPNELMLNWQIFRKLHPDQAQIWEQAFADQLCGDVTEEIDYLSVKKDGNKLFTWVATKQKMEDQL